MLGDIKPITLWRWEKAGRIRSVPGCRHKLWPVAQLERIVEGAA